MKKSEFQSMFQRTENSYGVILLGFTGVGKTTTLHGLSGHQLMYDYESKDFRCKDPILSSLFKIGNVMMSAT